MARKKGKLAAAGFERLDVPERRYKDPQGREVSYREAFRRATGRSLEQATEERGGRGAFRELFRLADQVRVAARNGLLSDAGLATRRQEDALASKTLRQMTKGHGPSAGTKAGMEGAPPDTRSLFGRLVLTRLHTDVVVERRDSESFPDYMDRVRAARYSERGRALIGPTSDKANLLVVLGRRSPDAEYSVGDTP